MIRLSTGGVSLSKLSASGPTGVYLYRRNNKGTISRIMRHLEPQPIAEGTHFHPPLTPPSCSPHFTFPHPHVTPPTLMNPLHINQNWGMLTCCVKLCTQELNWTVLRLVNVANSIDVRIKLYKMFSLVYDTEGEVKVRVWPPDLLEWNRPLFLLPCSVILDIWCLQGLIYIWYPWDTLGKGMKHHMRFLNM